MRLLGEDTLHSHFITNTYRLIPSNLNFLLGFILVLGILLLFATNNVAAITVDTSLDDSTPNGNCTLREAIQSVTTATNVDGCIYDNNIINFDSNLAGQPIFFTSTDPSDSFSRLVINTDLTIDGPNITLDGSSQRVLTVASGKNVNLIGLTIINSGSNAHSFGGNIHNSGVLTITNSMLKNGKAKYKGGGIYNASGASLTLYNSTVYNNQVSTSSNNNPGGGGIYNDGGAVTIINSTISTNKVTASGGNATANHGGGIYNNSGTLTIENSTITYNSVTNAKQGGGIYVANGTVAVRNSIIAGNSGTANYKDCKGTITSNGYNLVGATTGCPTTGTGDISFSGSITNIFDPFPDLVNGVHPLKLSSGNSALNAVPSGTNGCGTPPFDYDQLGTFRPYPQGGNCDIGAYEMAPIIYHQIGVNPAAKEEDLAGTKAFVITRYGGAISCKTRVDYTVTDDTGDPTNPGTDYQISALSPNGNPLSSNWDSGYFILDLTGQEFGMLKTSISSDIDSETNENIIVTLSNPTLEGTASSECQAILTFFGVTAPQFLLNDGTPFTNISATFTIVNDDLTVSAMTCDNPNPTNANPVSYTVTFNQKIASGITQDDFTATDNAPISSVTSANNQNYTVKVNTISSNDGLLQLNLVDTVPLITSTGGGTLGTGPFNQTCTIDKTPPLIDRVTVTDPVPYTSLDVVNTIMIEFSESVINFDLSDLTLTRDDTAIPLTSAQTLTTSDGGKTWVLSNLAALTITDGGYLLMVINEDIIDSANNILTFDTLNLNFWRKSPPFSLTITKLGSGNGTITGEGINCGTTCSNSYSLGTLIHLTITPDSNSIFAGWSGTNCSPPVTINANLTCTATFNSNSIPPSTAILTVTKAGTGNGTISGSGINCGNTCSYTYSQGTAVTLTAMPDGNSTFTGWSGTHCGSTFTITTPMNCTATFEKKIVDTPPTPPLPQTMTLTLNRQGNGQGEFEFSQNPQETNCDAGLTQCTYQFPTATWVTVTAKVDSHSTFKGWSSFNHKCYQNKGEQLEFFMSENYSCSAEFERQPPVLTLVTVGNGQILTSPIGNPIPCETGQCFQFAVNSEVTLTPQAGNGFHFDMWSGDPDCQAGQVKMDIDKICVATFSDTPPVQLVLAYDHNQGQIVLTPAGENCGENCQRYHNGTQVTLTVQPQPGFQLASWSGDCGNQTQATFGMTLDKNFHCGVNFTTTSPPNPSPPILSTLTIALAGSGTGIITSIPPGINCGIDCTESYQTGTRVTLVATPTSNSAVVNWSESCLSGQISLEADKTCQVTFELAKEEKPALSTIQLAMPQYQVNENGQGKVLVLVTRSGNDAGTVDVGFTTANGTAIANSDYTPLSGRLTWSNGDTTQQTITVPILQDDLTEGAETFVIQLSNLTGEAQLGTYSQTVVTIVDTPHANHSESAAPTESTGNDNVLPSPPLPPETPAGRIQFAAPIHEITEQDTLYPLEGFIKIPVFRLEGSQGEIAITYSTQNETAIAGKDYQQSEGQIVWANGETGEKNIIVDGWDNQLPEEAKSFRLILSNPTHGAILGEYPSISVLITDDDGSKVGFSPNNNYLAFEGNQQAKITVSRSNSSLGEVTLRYTTIDGTAKAGKDYVATSGTLTWGDSEHPDQTIHIPLLSSLNEVGNKTFQLSLLAPTGEVTLATPSTVSVTIMTSKPNLCELSGNIVDCLIIREKNSPILENIRITSRGALIGSRLAGQIQNAGWLQNTLLMPNTTVMGGQISGILSGQPEQPVTTWLHQVEVVAGTTLKYVGIGEGTQVNDQTNLGEGVCFEDNALIPNQNLSNLLGHTEQAVLGQRAVKLNRDVLCRSAINGLLGAINDLPQLNNLGWRVTQDPITGVLNLAMGNLHFAALPLQVKQVLTDEMVDELPLGITFLTSGEIIFRTHTGRKIITYPVIQAPLIFQAQLRQLGLNAVNLLANGHIEVPLVDDSYFVARADLVAKRVPQEIPIGLNYTNKPISLVFADQSGNHWQQMLYPAAAYPEVLNKLADSPSTTQLTPTGQIKIRHEGKWYEGTLDYLVTPNQQPRANDLQLINTDDLNGDGCNDSWIYYLTGEKQALLSACSKR